MKKSKFVQRMIAASALVLSSSTMAVWDPSTGTDDEALTLKPNLENGQEVYERICQTCHMIESWGSPDGEYPQLAGQHRQVLIKQILDIRNLNRDNPSMYPFSRPEVIGGSQGLADVTAYIGTLPMSPDNGLGPGVDVARGEELYKKTCVKCHGEHGEGNAEKAFPVIQSQHYAYMLRQFRWIKEGKRRNANPDMQKAIANFSDQDMSAVLDYVSRIEPPKNKDAAAAHFQGVMDQLNRLNEK